MKKILLWLMILGIGMFGSNHLIYSTSLAPAPSPDVSIIYLRDIRGAIDTLLLVRAIYGDEAINKAGYYKDRIFINGEDVNIVRDEARKWMKDSVYATIKQGINKLLDGGSITSTEYENLRSAYYTDIFDNKTDLVIVYKNFLNLEKQELNENDQVMKAFTYGNIKSGLIELKNKGIVTQGEFDSTLDLYYDMIFSQLIAPIEVDIQYRAYEKQITEKSIYRNTIYSRIKDKLNGPISQKISSQQIGEYLSFYYTEIFVNKKHPDDVYVSFLNLYSSLSSTSNNLQGTTTNQNSQVSPTTNPYYIQIKLQIGDKLSKLSLEKLESTLKRTKVMERRYKDGSKNKIRLQATITLLEEEIEIRMESEIDIESLLN